MAISDELMLKVENVSKVYKLGEIGGTTLRDELQRLKAKIFKKEDPTQKIGAKNYNKGEKFKALDNISFEVKKGERIGIIGHNGAGKSTLLKLISRVTGPTEGKIYLNGRVASMLEVGTGFHPELTGRENIYMNGAILGMTKKEIDSKIEDIIEFSEIRQFIDTPVKRYSSGMYVKLAFSVAAHLDSEIVIMDEVLAVGDINFQQKCIKKMKEISEHENRTILYVSHNMNTVRQLCDRVIVLTHGSVAFNGSVEQGISYYSNQERGSLKQEYELINKPRFSKTEGKILMTSTKIINNDNNSLTFAISFNSKEWFEAGVLRAVIFDETLKPIGTSFSLPFSNIVKGKNCFYFCLDVSVLVNGIYIVDFIISTYSNEMLIRQDVVNDAIRFELLTNNISVYGMKWITNSWGSIYFPNMKVIKHE